MPPRNNIVHLSPTIQRHLWRGAAENAANIAANIAVRIGANIAERAAAAVVCPLGAPQHINSGLLHLKIRRSSAHGRRIIWMRKATWWLVQDRYHPEHYPVKSDPRAPPSGGGRQKVGAVVARAANLAAGGAIRY